LAILVNVGIKHIRLQVILTFQIWSYRQATNC